MSDPIKNRYDFVVYYDVENGNPNGDPDAGNMPRVDPETSYGLVTDVCIKRKIRNYIETIKEGEPGYEIYIKEGVPLKTSDERAFEKLGLSTSDKGQIKEAKENNSLLEIELRNAMCELYYDVRTFGAVITSLKNDDYGLNGGQVRGPVQLTFSRSVDPVSIQGFTIDRVTDPKTGKSGITGTKYVVPYALYRFEGFVSANLARKTTGFSEDDLELLWQAIINMFENDHSAARGKMVVRSFIVFKHDSELGNAPSYKLFDAVSTRKREGIEVPRCITDYEDISVDESQIPAGVEVIRMV